MKCFKPFSKEYKKMYHIRFFEQGLNRFNNLLNQEGLHWEAANLLVKWLKSARGKFNQNAHPPRWGEMNHALAEVGRNTKDAVG